MRCWEKNSGEEHCMEALGEQREKKDGERKDEECVEVGRVRGNKRRDKRGQRFLGVQGVQAGAGNMLYWGCSVWFRG